MQTSTDPQEFQRIVLQESPAFSLFKLDTLKALTRKPKYTPEQTVLPSKRLCLENQSVDLDKLKQFQQVCGYEKNDKLPISFLHLAAFDLQSALLTDASMPLPLLGMVHLENSISRFRDIGIDERFNIEVFLANKSAHRLGITFEACCEISVENELVWQESSKTLCRLPKQLLSKNSTASATESQEGMVKHSRRPCSEHATVWKVAGDVGRRYGAASGDRNPIHLWPITAKLFGFKRHIAHGMWTLARAAAEFEQSFEGKPICYRTQFVKPVFLPARVHYYEADQKTNNPGRTELSVQVWNTTAGRLHMNASVNEL